MKKFFCFCLVCFICFFAFVSAYSANLFDDFSASHLDSSKWDKTKNSGGLERVCEVEGGKLISKIYGVTDNSGMLLRQLSIADPNTIHTFAADVAYVEGEISSDYTNSTWAVGAQVEGFFYQESGGAVWAGITIGSDGTTFGVNYGVNSSTGGGISGDSFALPVQQGTEYTLKIEYDGNNQFTFWVNNESHTVIGPTRTGESSIEYKGLTTGIWGNNSGIAGGYVSATFDDVKVNGSLHDDFSSPSLDPVKWWAVEHVREIRDGQLQLSVQNIGADKRTMDLYLDTENITDYFQTDISIDSSSTISGDNTHAQARLYGAFCNHKYDTTEYNGAEGDVFAGVYINLYADNTFKIYAIAWACADAACDTDTSLFSQEFSYSAEFDTPVTVAVERRGNTLIFSCNNEKLLYSFDTKVFAPYAPSRKFRSRVYSATNEYGYIKAKFDNVYTEKSTSWNLFLPAILNGKFE